MKKGEEVRNPFLATSPDERLTEAVERLKFDVQYALQAAMKKRGVDQAGLAMRLGVTPARVSQMFADDANLRLNSVAKAFAVLGEEIQFSSESAPLVPRMTHSDAETFLKSGGPVTESSVEKLFRVILKSIENEAQSHEGLEREESERALPRRRSARSEKQSEDGETAEHWQTVAIRSGPAPAPVRHRPANEQTFKDTNQSLNEAA